MDAETLKSLAELGYAFILIAWLMRTNGSLTDRLRETQDKFFLHLEGDIQSLLDDDDKKDR